MSYLTRAIRFVRHWHARLGVLLAFFFLMLAFTGMALNHTEALALAKHEVNAGWLMRWYGLKATVPDSGFLYKDGYLVVADNRWVMDGHLIAGEKPIVAGALSWNNMRAFAAKTELYLYTSDAQLIDKLTDSALPGKPIERLGVSGSALVIKTGQGEFKTQDGLIWQALNVDREAQNPVIWSEPSKLPESAMRDVTKLLAPSLPLERILLDLHSGRIFGRYGHWLMDAAALGMAILSVSGLWIYLRSIRRSKR